MSFEAVAYVFKNCKYQPMTKLVLLCLASYADEHGYCYPRISTIAERCNVSTRTVQRSIQELFESQEIRIIERGGMVDGKGTPNTYQVVMKEGCHKVTPGVTNGQGRVTYSHKRGDTQSPKGCHTATQNNSVFKSLEKSEDESNLETIFSGTQEPNKAKPRNQKEVEDFCKEIGLPKLDGEYFYFKWQAGNGKTPKDWKATIRSWKAGGYCPSQKNSNQQQSKPKQRSLLG